MKKDRVRPPRPRTYPCGAMVSLASIQTFGTSLQFVAWRPTNVSSWHDGVFDHRNRESIPIYTRYHASDGDFRRRLPSISGATGISASVDPCHSMGQHDAKLMLSTLWCGQLTRLSGALGHQNRDCRTARSNSKTCPSRCDALRTVYGTFWPWGRKYGWRL
jgi:hypothetical protein